MTRLLTGTAIGLLMGLTPALAQTDMPVDETQSPPALQQPAMPSDTLPPDVSDPAQPIPGESSEMLPSDDGTSTAMPKATLDEPRSIAPEDAIEEAATLNGPRFLTKQASDDWLASNLIGQPVVNAKDEAIGDINDLVTDKDGKVVAVLIGAGGFLGLGEKDVAVNFDDLKIARDEDHNVKVISDLTSEMLSSAPDYERLNEQAVNVGAADGEAAY
jgi:sporulation protein YlmC with PRC-barrel domain